MRTFTSSRPDKQGGFAAILLILLAGLGITAAVISTASYIRGAQEQHLTTHTVTQAQLRAWNGAEAIRLYLSTLDVASATTLPTGTLSISGLSGLSATVISNVASISSNRRITVNLTGAGSEATTTIQAVYNVQPYVAATTPAAGINAVNIKKNLDLTGNITMFGSSDVTNINVDGTITLSGSITGINQLCSTGDITIGSAITVNTICTNGSLTMTGGATVTDASVIGNVTLSGDTQIGAIVSNGNVTLSGGSARATSISTRGNVDITGGSARASSISAMGNVTWSSTYQLSGYSSAIAANGNVAYSGFNNSTNINALGNVALTGNGNVNNINTKGNTSISSYGGGLGVQGTLNGEGTFSWSSGIKVNLGTVGGVISPVIPASVSPPINVSQVTGNSVSITPVDVPVINPIEVTILTIDVYPLKGNANYVFEVDASNRRKVTVKNVNGITDGTYFLGNYAWASGRGYKDFLCTELKADNETCQSPATPYKTLCHGQSTSNGCFTYSSSDRTWTVSGISMAPGVVWFDGNLSLGNGKYFNTMLATGNITTAGSMVIYSLNYAGYTAICTNNRTAYGQTASSDFTGMYPTNYCNTTTQQLFSTSLGNAALIAGGYQSGVFVGGTINLGASNQVYGSLFAGDVVNTSGNSSVYGQITVAAQGSGTTTTTWRGTTRVEMPSNITGYDPTAQPCMANCPTNTGTTTILWSRYL